MSVRRTAFVGGAVLAAVSAVVASAAGGAPDLRLSLAGRYSTPGDYTYALASGDLNRDGRTDVVTGDTDSEGPPGFDKTALLLSRRGGRLSAARDLHFSASSDVELVDLNGDRNLDVVRIGRLSGGGGPGVYEWRGAVLLGNGRGRFPTRRSFVVPANTGNLDAIAAGDFNRDGRRDLAVIESGLDEPGVWVLSGDGDGGFSDMRRYPTAESAQDMVVADFNRDRNPDLAVASLEFYGRGAVVILFGDGAGHFAAASRPVAGGDPVSLVARDFNRDGDADLAIADAARRRPGVRVLLGDGRGDFSDPARYRVSRVVGSIAFADLDRDGIGDLLVTELGIPTGRPALRVLPGNGRGRFRRGERFALDGQDMGPVVVAKVNRDRKPDVIVAHGSDNGVSVLINGTRR